MKHCRGMVTIRCPNVTPSDDHDYCRECGEPKPDPRDKALAREWLTQRFEVPRVTPRVHVDDVDSLAALLGDVRRNVR